MSRYVDYVMISFSRDFLRFCYTHLIKSDLDAIFHIWNIHYIFQAVLQHPSTTCITEVSESCQSTHE